MRAGLEGRAALNGLRALFMGWPEDGGTKWRVQIERRSARVAVERLQRPSEGTTAE